MHQDLNKINRIWDPKGTLAILQWPYLTELAAGEIIFRSVCQDQTVEVVEEVLMNKT